jgi:hypothetical protein
MSVGQRKHEMVAIKSFQLVRISENMRQSTMRSETAICSALGGALPTQAHRKISPIPRFRALHQSLKFEPSPGG